MEMDGQMILILTYMYYEDNRSNWKTQGPQGVKHNNNKRKVTR